MKSAKYTVALFILSLMDAWGCQINISSITPVSFSWTGGTVTTTNQILLTRNTTGWACKRFHITMTEGNSGSYARKMSNGSYQLNYNLFKNNARTNVIFDYPDVTKNKHIIRGSFPNSSMSKAINFYTSMPIPPSASTIKGGHYSDTVTVKVYKGNRNPLATLMDSNTLSVSTFVPKMVNLSLVDSGAPFDIADIFQTLDFGVLNSGDTKSFDVRVESNAGYEVTFSSQNNGVLKHLTQADTIPYILKVNSSVKNLSTSSTTPIQVAYGSGVTNSGGEVNSVSVTIGNFGLKTAGSYSDIITIEVATTE